MTKPAIAAPDSMKANVAKAVRYKFLCRMLEEPNNGDFLDMARAAIEAMRESTPAMWMAGGYARFTYEDQHGADSYGLCAKAQWEAMIDVVLAEKTQ